MPAAARWSWIPAATAPVALVGGWTLAAALRDGAFDATRETISELAAQGAPDRWLMTTALAVVGICHIGTAVGLRAATVPGRVVLAIGGVATLGVAALPLQETGSDTRHGLAAAAAFGALSLWPVLASRTSATTLPRILVIQTGAAATLGLAALLVWFGAELVLDGDRVGSAERWAAAAQALWPLAVVAGCRLSGRGR